MISMPVISICLLNIDHYRLIIDLIRSAVHRKRSSSSVFDLMNCTRSSLQWRNGHIYFVIQPSFEGPKLDPLDVMSDYDDDCL